MLELKFAELHNPLFLAGKNFGTKLDPGHIGGLKIEYDAPEKKLVIHWAGDVALIPDSNVACMVPGEPKKRAEQKTHPMVANLQSAQVSGPQSHVFAGPGAGKTGKG